MFWLKKLKNKMGRDFACCAQRGFTFLEILISLLVLSAGVLSTLGIINVAMNTHYRAVQETIVSNLATGLMSEILAKKFEESPGDTTFGIEAPEYRFDTTVYWDDVDDYYSAGGFLDSPPYTIGGLLMEGNYQNVPHYPGFSRSVTVEWYNTTTAAVDSNPTSCKQITVTVSGPAVNDYQVIGHKSAPPP